jgi:cytochrome c oxidase cbb3-type subunit 1
MDDSELVHKPLVRAWARWALVSLTVFPFVGILVSIQFHNPEFLGGMSWSTFGRLRSVHLGGVLFGSFTTAFIGLLYYFVPRLCGTPLYKVEWGGGCCGCGTASSRLAPCLSSWGIWSAWNTPSTSGRSI